MTVERKFTTDQLAKCARREVAMRRQVYRYRVDQGKITQAEADKETAMMREIALILEDMAKGPTLL